MTLIPRDLRHAIQEVSGQAPQLPLMRQALERLPVPIHLVHGDKDDFAPIEAAERLAAQTATHMPIRQERVAGADHFLNNGPPERLLACLEACIPLPAPRRPLLALPKFAWPFEPVSPMGEAAGA